MLHSLKMLPVVCLRVSKSVPMIVEKVKRYEKHCSQYNLGIPQLRSSETMLPCPNDRFPLPYEEVSSSYNESQI